MSMTSISQQQKKYSGGSLAVYKEMVIGSAGWGAFLSYEAINLLLNNLPGLLGFAFRSFFYPYMLKECGGRPAIGKQVLIRGGRQMTLGNKVMIDDQAVLDARGKDAEVHLADFVSIGRGSAIISKNAKITLAEGVNISTNCRIASESSIEIGKGSLVAAYCYIGPGDHSRESGKAIIEQPMQNRGGVKIGENVWIAARATIMDGVSIGNNSIVAAHSFVKDNVPENTIVGGCPAKVIKEIT